MSGRCRYGEGEERRGWGREEGGGGGGGSGRGGVGVKEDGAVERLVSRWKCLLFLKVESKVEAVCCCKISFSGNTHTLILFTPSKLSKCSTQSRRLGPGSVETDGCSSLQPSS